MMEIIIYWYIYCAGRFPKTIHYLERKNITTSRADSLQLLHRRPTCH